MPHNIRMKKLLPDIKTLEKVDRPREKLQNQGAESLTDLELLAILIGSGNKKRKLNQIARDVESLYDEIGISLTLTQLQAIQGIGSAKATLLLAATEFIRRRTLHYSVSVQHPEDVKIGRAHV